MEIRSSKVFLKFIKDRFFMYDWDYLAKSYEKTIIKILNIGKIKF